MKIIKWQLNIFSFYGFFPCDSASLSWQVLSHHLNFPHSVFSRIFPWYILKNASFRISAFPATLASLLTCDRRSQPLIQQGLFFASWYAFVASFSIPSLVSPHQVRLCPTDQKGSPFLYNPYHLTQCEAPGRGPLGKWWTLARLPRSVWIGFTPCPMGTIFRSSGRCLHALRSLLPHFSWRSWLVLTTSMLIKRRSTLGKKLVMPKIGFIWVLCKMAQPRC